MDSLNRRREGVARVAVPALFHERNWALATIAETPGRVHDARITAECRGQLLDLDQCSIAATRMARS